MQKTHSEYDTDFSLWSQHQAQAIREQRWQDVDLTNVAEEIESLGKSERRAVKNLLVQAFFHYFKIQNVVDIELRDLPHWKAEVRNFVQQLEDLLDESPSIRPDIRDYIAEATARGRRLFEAAYPGIPVDSGQPPQTIGELDKL